MEVTTIVMEPEAARAKLEAYRQGLEKRHSREVDKEWTAAERAYAELAKGTVLIDPISAIREAGCKEDGRPRLAMVRADQRFCRWEIQRHSRWWDSEKRTYQGKYAPMVWSFKGRKDKSWDRQRANNLDIKVHDVKTEPPAEPKPGLAMVPMVPPDILPARGCDLSKHFILWEVESWDVAPPVDPILLRPIGGDLYAVIAQWDLTELERTILRGMRSE